MKDRPIRVLALAGTLVVLLLSSVLAARPEPALPAEMPASERSRLAAVTATASLATHAAGEPFVARREVFEYLLDHPEFAAHLTRTLRIARYRRSEEHTSELQSPCNLVCRLLLEKKKKIFYSTLQ